MSWIVDVGVVALVVLLGLAGWFLGLLRGVLGFAGLVLGGVVTTQLIIPLLRDWSVPAQVRLIAAVAATIVLCATGLFLGGYLGQWLRSRDTDKPLPKVDRGGGAVIGVLVALLASWSIATTLMTYPNQDLRTSVSGSKVLGGIDAVLPDQATQTLSGAQSSLSDMGVPQGIAGLTSITDGVPVPAAADVLTTEVVRSLQSVVRVYGVAQACQLGFTGSGYVSSPAHVTTNAHVVAAMAKPQVQVPGLAAPLAATTVLFNPDLDVAVLYVPGLTAAPLRVVDTAKPGDPGVIAGYPGGGALTSDPGRVQSAFTDTLGVGTDIYGNPGTPRRVLLIAGANAPGNSGGPFLTTRGEVAGLMSAQRAKDNPSAFALAPAQYSPITAAAASSRSPVGTGPCPKG